MCVNYGNVFFPDSDVWKFLQCITEASRFCIPSSFFSSMHSIVLHACETWQCLDSDVWTSLQSFTAASRVCGPSSSFSSPMQASDAPFPAITAEDIDRRIEERVEGDLKFLDGATGMAQLALNKHVRKL